MAQKYGFFNSVNNDRVYDAADVARFLSKFFTNGIFNNSLAVSSNDNMTVSVATGQANINGYGYENTEILTLDIDEADSELSRIDSVIVRLDLTNRQITAMILQGQYATTPSQPSIIRSGNVYDLRLANILVSAGTTKITTEDITDTRFGSDCGNVTQAVLELSTDEIFNQYETWFTNWYQNLQDQLDDNQAGHLQNEIDEINNNIGEINNDINSISQTVNIHYQEQQTNFQKLEKVLLYENLSGTYDDIECSDELTNYGHLQIDYKHQRKYGSVIVPVLSPFEISSTGFAEGTIVQLGFMSYNINGKAIEINDSGIVNFQNGAIQYQGTSKTIAILKVVGIKE